MANAQLQAEFIENGRGGHYPVRGGFKYSIRTRRNDRIYWRCVERNCNSVLVTLNNIPVTVPHNHNHTSDHVGLAASAFVNQMKKRCREELTPVPTLFNEELDSLRNRDYDDDGGGDLIRKVPFYESCKSSLYRSRSKVLPKLPKSRNELELENRWTETSAGERFLLCNDNNDRGLRIVVFATDSNLQHLCQSDVVLGDGTFYSCPDLFYQFYSLHGYVEETV